MTRQESFRFFLQSCIDSLARITEEDRIAARYSFYVNDQISRGCINTMNK